MGPLLIIESTSCHRDYLLLSRLPVVIRNTSCYRDYLLLSRLPLVIRNTSCYWKHLLLLEAPLVIETTSCYQEYLLLSETPLVIESTSCCREHFLLSKGIHRKAYQPETSLAIPIDYTPSAELSFVHCCLCQFIAPASAEGSTASLYPTFLFRNSTFTCKVTNAHAEFINRMSQVSLRKTSVSRQYLAAAF